MAIRTVILYWHLLSLLDSSRILLNLQKSFFLFIRNCFLPPTCFQSWFESSVFPSASINSCWCCQSEAASSWLLSSHYTNLVIRLFFSKSVALGRSELLRSQRSLKISSTTPSSIEISSVILVFALWVSVISWWCYRAFPLSRFLMMRDSSLPSFGQFASWLHL
jgi:hypothetical protein